MEKISVTGDPFKDRLKCSNTNSKDHDIGAQHSNIETFDKSSEGYLLKNIGPAITDNVAYLKF